MPKYTRARKGNSARELIICHEMLYMASTNASVPTGNNKPANNKVANKKPANKPANNKPANNKVANNKPANNKSANNKSANNKPVNKPAQVESANYVPAEPLVTRDTLFREIGIL